ncbi:MAG TPA: DUF5668 domain-containing protein [Candidatus Acidoferrales bacterium]|nr:DUF5668 domain-containing protein [Candidatus Acidoferrales bacterium]
MGNYYYRRGGLVGPMVLITIGALFMADRWWPGMSFGRLWPVILIVIGVVRLLEMGMPSHNTMYPAPPQNPPPPPGSTPPPGVTPPPGGSQ